MTRRIARDGFKARIALTEAARTCHESVQRHRDRTLRGFLLVAARGERWIAVEGKRQHVDAEVLASCEMRYLRTFSMLGQQLKVNTGVHEGMLSMWLTLAGRETAPLLVGLTRVCRRIPSRNTHAHMKCT